MSIIPNALPDEHRTEGLTPSIIMTTDIESYGQLDDTDQLQVSGDLKHLLHEAFVASKLGKVWASPLFTIPSGDGYNLGLSTEHLGRVIDFVPLRLQQMLRFRWRTAKVPLRIRLGFSVGPVPSEIPDGQLAPQSKHVIESFRMLDSLQLKRLLLDSDPEVTHVVVAMSSTVVDWAIRKKPTALSESQLAESTTVNKELREQIYFYVPQPSGELVRNGLAASLDAAQPTEEESEPIEELPDLAPEIPFHSYEVQHAGNAGDNQSGGVNTGDISTQVGGISTGENSNNHNQGSIAYGGNAGEHRSYHNQAGGDINQAERDIHVKKKEKTRNRLGLLGNKRGDDK